MTEPKFTPAPWIVTETQFSFIVEAEKGLDLAEIEKIFDDDYFEGCKANANLIAAAPDLYDFIARLVNSGSSLDILKIVEEGELLLAKARGKL